MSILQIWNMESTQQLSIQGEVPKQLFLYLTYVYELERQASCRVSTTTSAHKLSFVKKCSLYFLFNYLLLVSATSAAAEPSLSGQPNTNLGCWSLRPRRAQAPSDRLNLFSVPAAIAPAHQFHRPPVAIYYLPSPPPVHTVGHKWLRYRVRSSTTSRAPLSASKAASRSSRISWDISRAPHRAQQMACA
jgi:hypothetical protein